MTYETATLPCGLRIICAPSHSPVAYCGIAVDAGTRDEKEGESGMAHFTEHLSFKGTERRKSWHIIDSMESVGGDLNAYTGKEETVYYTTFLKEHVGKAIDILLDITLHSSFPQTEMDKEVEVVIEEIESYNDSPSELIYDDFESLLFEGHPLGRNILGEAQLLKKQKSEDIRRFVHRLYRPERMVLFLYGDVPLKKIVCEAEKNLARYPLSEYPAEPVLRKKPLPLVENIGTHTVEKDTHQAHVMIGTRSYSTSHPDYLALFLLNNILGGPCMSSRLNLALRERNGLVYTVESSLVGYTDTGMWSVYFGCDPEEVDRCIRLVHKELSLLAESPLSLARLRKARKQLQGQIGISWDSGESVAIGMGKRLLHYGTTLSCSQLCEKIEALTSEQLWHTAQEIFNPEKMTTLIYR